jgi:hypothetical protein
MGCEAAVCDVHASPRSTSYTFPVAKVGPTTTDDAPPLDPEAVERAYHFHRAKRAARERRHQESRLAAIRFWLVLALVVLVAAVVAARTMGEIERVFGL